MQRLSYDYACSLPFHGHLLQYQSQLKIAYTMNHVIVAQIYAPDVHILQHVP